MASTNPCILTLPCEIRDIVYDNLFQDVSFQYKWADHGYKYDPDDIYEVTDSFAGYLSHPVLSPDVQVCVHEAPPPNIRLAHSRFNDESKDRSLRNRSATIRIKE
jgi:hypothetical protein